MGNREIDDFFIARWRFQNQHLSGATAESATAVVDHLLGVQAENHSQASWAVTTRCSGLSQSEFDRIFDVGEILRTHVLRPTWHFVRPHDLIWLLELTGPRIRKSYVQAQKLSDLSSAAVERGILVVTQAIGSAGPLSRGDLGVLLAESGLVKTGQAVGVILAFAEIEGLICSGPVVGSEHTYALVSDRVPSCRRLDRDAALVELVYRYLKGHGPATERDVAYWASLTLTDVRLGLVGSDLGSFEHDGRVYWHVGEMPDQVDDPGGHLLQILDECYRGYQDSRWVIDAAGNVPRTREKAIGMAVVDAQIVASMRRTIRTSTVEFELDPYRQPAPSELESVERAAHRYGTYLGLEPVLSWNASPTPRRGGRA